MSSFSYENAWEEIVGIAKTIKESSDSDIEELGNFIICIEYLQSQLDEKLSIEA